VDVCEAKIPKKKNPRIIIYNLFKVENNESNKIDIKEALIEQNIDIKNYLKKNDKENDLKIKYFIKAKNEKLCHLVIEVTAELRKIIINAQKVNIHWSRHSVKDFVSITRCFNCLSFGHSKDNCSVRAQICSQCTESGHSFKECSNESNHKTCINCKKFNSSIKNPNIKKYDTKHDALYGGCPSLSHIKTLITSKIDYGL
jgi:hypothetical protein